MGLNVKDERRTFDFMGKQLEADVFISYAHVFDDPSESAGTAGEIDAVQSGEMVYANITVEASFSRFSPGVETLERVFLPTSCAAEHAAALVSERGLVDRAIDDLREQMKQAVRDLEAA